MIDLTTLRDVAVEAAWQAGQITLSYFQTPLDIEWKSDQSPVTVADRLAEKRIREIIQRYYPDHTVIGEEYGETVGTSRYRWIIDPIDGTRSFARGIAIYGVLIGIEYNDQPMVGVVYLPALNEWVTAICGQGCYWNHRRSQVSTTKEWSKALILVGDEAWIKHGSPRYPKLLSQVQVPRNWGDCYSYVLVATGRAEAAFDPRMNPWDCAPFPTILAESEGLCTDFNGQPSIWNGSLVVSNGHLHDELLMYLQPTRDES